MKTNRRGFFKALAALGVVAMLPARKAKKIPKKEPTFKYSDYLKTGYFYAPYLPVYTTTIWKI